jgi:predicted enzyme related to lactoylglutathione lyase
VDCHEQSRAKIMDIPNVGRYARVQDSEGNVIGVIKPIMP